MINVNSKYLLEVEYITGTIDKIEVISANEPTFKVNTNRGSYELSYKMMLPQINSWGTSYVEIAAIIRFKILSIEPIMEKDIEVINLKESDLPKLQEAKKVKLTFWDILASLIFLLLMFSIIKFLS